MLSMFHCLLPASNPYNQEELANEQDTNQDNQAVNQQEIFQRICLQVLCAVACAFYDFCGSTLFGVCKKHKPNEMSGGQQQRVAIARALAKNPKLLLCDEPTGALDYQTGKAILQLLQDTGRKTGMTVIIITHNGALTSMADRVIRVKNGTIASVTRNENPQDIAEIEW